MNIYTNKIKKSITGVLLVTLLFVQVVSVPNVFAEEAPTPPTAPEAPSAPTPPTAPEAPSAPTPPTAPEAPEAPKAPEAPTAPEAPHTPEGSTTTQQTTSQPTQGSTGTNSDGNVGDTSIGTGDATNDANVTTTGNLNASSSGGGQNGGTSVENSGNGAGSTNNGSATTNNTSNTNQDNSASVVNNVDQSSVTGNNSASLNVGDSSIVTGDANTSGTIITAVNTNIDGVLVSEFNIADDHVGDILLDFGNLSNCVVGCGDTATTSATNSGNGANSTNSTDATTNNTDNTFQNNDGSVENNMTLVSDSGNNDASLNTGGDSSITTGDANVSANVLTFLNNNLAGNVVLGIVNIFGDLVGDIIFQDPSGGQNCTNCGNNMTAANTGNGADSTNTSNATSNNADNTFQSNDATIENNLILDANTGDNDANFNTDGNSSVTTGNTSVDANLLNVANMNIAGGDVWLVIVNEAGNWIGRIMGAPEGSNYAGSVGTEFVVGPNGEITAYNSGNGAGSTNNTNATSNNTTNTTQTNNAHVVNNLDLTANTGGNSTTYNTGGNNSITTGDAQIIANLVNFVNNNISGGGSLYVNVVNVFGSWLGDFVTPGHTKEKNDDSRNNNSDNTAHVGGQNTTNITDRKNENENDVVEMPATTQVAQITSQAATTFAAAYGNFAGILGTKESDEKVQKSDFSLPGADNQKEAVEINLAWLLMLVPALPLGFIEKKYGIARGAAHKLLSILL